LASSCASRSPTCLRRKGSRASKSLSAVTKLRD
jgi:hypothetical protein